MGHHLVPWRRGVHSFVAPLSQVLKVLPPRRRKKGRGDAPTGPGYPLMGKIQIVYDRGIYSNLYHIDLYILYYIIGYYLYMILYDII